MDIDKANQEAVDRMMAARPLLKEVSSAAEVIPSMEENLIIHAGPPIEWERMSGPLKGAVIGALIFEGLAKDEQSARGMAEAGEVKFEPCHHHASAGPMAGVISPSMAVYVLENVTHGNKAFSNFNEGYGKVLRYGAFSDEVLDRLRWINAEMAPLLGEAIASSDGLDLRALLAEALHMGDEGHNRNKAGSLLYLKWLSPLISQVAKDQEQAAAILQNLGDNALSVLNPVMAACKAMTDAAHGIEGSTIVTAMARNGTDFGIRISGMGEDWFTAPAEIPDGS
jgi:hypothetical protein